MKVHKDRDFSTWTNLAYALVALIIVALDSWLAMPVALALMFLTYGSMYYHFHRDHKFAWADWAAMYFVFVTQIGYFILVLFEAKNSLGLYTPLAVIIICYAISVMLAIINDWWQNKENFAILGFLYAVNLGLSFFIIETWIAIASLFIFAVSFSIRTIAEQNGTGGKNSPDYDHEFYDILHGIWHLGTALGFCLWYFK